MVRIGLLTSTFLVARDVRRIYPGSFLGPDGSQKDVRNVARMSCNAIRK